MAIFFCISRSPFLKPRILRDSDEVYKSPMTFRSINFLQELVHNRPQQLFRLHHNLQTPVFFHFWLMASRDFINMPSACLSSAKDHAADQVARPEITLLLSQKLSISTLHEYLTNNRAYFQFLIAAIVRTAIFGSS